MATFATGTKKHITLFAARLFKIWTELENLYSHFYSLNKLLCVSYGGIFCLKYLCSLSNHVGIGIAYHH